MSETQANPLDEVSPESLEALFSADPKNLSDEEIDRIVVAMRAQRGKFLTVEATPKEVKAKAKIEAKAKPAKGSVVLALEDLGL